MDMKSLYLSVNSFNRAYVFLSAFALWLGGIIYLLLRSSEHVFFRWISAAGIEKWFMLARHHTHSLNLHLPEWIVFSLPNGLWAFSYSLLITCIWSGSKSRLRYFWMASIPVLVLGYEVLQYAGIIHGTFCIQDIAFGVAGLIGGILLGIKTTKSKNHEKTSE